MRMSLLAKRNLTIPNMLSVFRIFLVVPFIMFVAHTDFIKAGFVLAVSGVTDVLDGFIARRFNQVTDLGAMLDPIADKITLIAVMVCVGLYFPVAFPFMIILILKEFVMLFAGAFLLKLKQTPPSAKWYGKIATIVFYASTIIIIGLKAFWDFQSDLLNITLMSITAFCMFYAIYGYSQIFFEIVKNKKQLTK